MTTNGSYAGFALQDNRGRVVAMSLNVRRWIEDQPTVAQSPVTSVSETLTLRPGRYRLLFLTDGASTVTLPASGDLARTLRPTGRYSDDVRITNITSALPIASSFTSERVNIRQGGFLALALHSETYLNQIQYTALCIAQPDSPTCNPVGDLGGNVVRQSVGSDVRDGWTSLRYTTPNAPTGVFDARFEDAAADSGTRRDSLVVVI